MNSHSALFSAKNSKSPMANWACSHPFYDLVFQWLIKRIRGLSEPAVFLIIGPTGVGKSTLISHLISRLAAEMMDELKTDTSRLHKVYAETVYVPSRGLDWEGLFKALLKDGKEILIDRKVAKVWPPEAPNLRGLAEAVDNMLFQHAPAACIIDEGGLFWEVSSDESLNRTLEYLKSIGNRSRTHIAIFGDYRLAKMLHFNGQLNRRCHPIHFSNYTEGFKDNFEVALRAFEARLKQYDVSVCMDGTVDMLFSETCGCVGLLKRWIENAWIEVDGTDRVLDKSVLESECFPAGSLAKWRAEIRAGHEVMEFFINGKKS